MATGPAIFIYAQGRMLCGAKACVSGFRDFEAPRGIEQALAKLEQDWDVTYADGQRNAIVTALSSPVMILTGGPGTGKTTAVRGMLALLDGIGSKTVLAAPTGRAAKRLSELCGREAKTIHRLLEVVFTSEGLEYAHHEQNPCRQTR